MLFAALLVSFSLALGTRKYSGLTRIVFLNVGQGDAIYIETPSGDQILVDGGPDSSVINELGRVMPFFDRDLDVVVSTHPDADHLFGLLDVLRRYKVKIVFDSGLACANAACLEFDKLIQDHNIARQNLFLGYEINTGDGLVLKVVNPDSPPPALPSDKIDNNQSLGLMLQYGKEKVLLTGDMELKAELKSMALFPDLRADFLKIGHHGAKTSSGDTFLDAVSPKAAIIEVGKNNRYGHPAADTLNKLAQKGITYYRTDIDGRVELLLDGLNFVLNTQNK